MRLAVFDVGGSYIKYACSTISGTLSGKGKVATPKQKESFHEMIRTILQSMGEVDGLAFSLPGFIDSERGYISLGGSLRYHDNCSFIEEMQNLFHLPITIQNDAKCAALAEVWKGCGSNYRNAVVLVFGTGVGGAFLQDGNVYMGSHFMTCEFSCMITGDLQKQGAEAVFGNQFSIPLLVQRIAKRIGQNDIDGESIFRLAEQGNAEILEELQQFYHKLAVHIYNLQCCYDPDVFFIGGGISQQNSFVLGIRKAAEAFVSQLPFPLPIPEIHSMTHKADANLLGAVYQFQLSQGVSE